MSSPPTAQVPNDLQGARAQQIQLLNYLLGLGGTGGGGNGGFWDRAKGVAGGGGGAGNFQGGADVLNRLEGFFGTLGSPATGLQQQATDAISHTLSADPTKQASDFLNNLLTQKPGQGIIDAAQPGFDRNLAAANQTGARFGSNNAILRSRAVDDFNMLSANAAQQGINQQLAAAQGLGTLAQDQFSRQAGAFGIGQAGAQQADLETQRRLQILFQLLAQLQGPTLGAPVKAGRSALDNIGQGVAIGTQAAGSLFGGV